MITKALQHARENLVAYLALFIALGGTSYAAVNLPAESVGSKQLRNHSISPVKFNRQFLNGNIRAWVVAKPDGTVQASAGKPTVRVTSTAPSLYVIKWKVPAPSQRGCFAIGGLTDQAPQAGSAAASLFVSSQRRWEVGVNTYGPQGQALAQPFYAALIC